MLDSEWLVWGRQTRALIRMRFTVWKVNLFGSIAELCLPALFMALLVLIKNVTTVHESPNVSYTCGQMYPWMYTDVDGPYPDEGLAELADCFRKPDGCHVDGYYTAEVSVPQIDQTLYFRNGYIQTAGAKGYPFYGFTVGDESHTYDYVNRRLKEFNISMPITNPSLSIRAIGNRLQSYGRVIAVAPADDENVAKFAKWLNHSMHGVVRMMKSSETIDEVTRSRDYEDTEKIAFAIVFDETPTEGNNEWEYRIRNNVSVIELENVACLYSNCERTYQAPLTILDTVPLLKPPTEQFLYGYAYSGFLALQQAVDQYIMQDAIGDEEEIRLQASMTIFPVEKYSSDDFQTVVAQAIGLFYMLAFLYPAARLLRELVMEKENRIRESLLMMGMKRTAYLFSWFTFRLVQMIITVCLMILVTAWTVFEYSNKLVVFLWLFTFASSLLSLSLLLSTFFRRAKSASTVGTIIFFAAYFPFYAVNEEEDSPSAKVWTCLLSPTCLALGGSIVADYEGGGVGVRFNNLFNEQPERISLGTCILMNILDALIYGILAIILDDIDWKSVKWFFIYTSQWLWNHIRAPCYRKVEEEDPIKTPLLGEGDEEKKEEENPFKHPRKLTREVEGVPIELSRQTDDGRSIEIRDLVKIYDAKGRKQVAVNGLTLSVYEGQITVLLGHNGAGKTTTISMITGMTPITSGELTIRGLDARQQMKAIRKDLGVCPQHDILIPELSPIQQLRLCAVLKGVKDADVETECLLLLREVGLAEKIDSRSSCLSGGQKRMLSLAMSFMGKSRVVILDEPTSGMDPYTRRATWNLLQRKRKGRVILLTTHFMDEADILGDRIAIMADGRLCCCGSSLFLKSLYGVGYTITITHSSREERYFHDTRSKTSDIVQFVTSIVPSAHCTSDIGQETTFRIPFSACQEFPFLFQQLDDRKTELGVESYGVSVTKLEEVFMRIGRHELIDDDLDSIQSTSGVKEVYETDEPPSKVQHSSINMSSMGLKESRPALWEVSGRQDRYGSDFGIQFRSLCRKRWLYWKRDKKSFCYQLIIPTMLVLVGLIILRISQNYVDAPDYELTPLRFNKDKDLPYRNFVPVRTSNEYGERIAEQFNMVNVDGMRVEAERYSSDQFGGCAKGAEELIAMSNFLLDPDYNKTSERGSTRYGAVTFPDDVSPRNLVYNVMVNSSAVHGGPIFLNLVNNAILQTLTNVSSSIRTRIDPLPVTQLQKSYVESADAFTVALMISVAFSFLPASYVIFVVKERESGSKHQQVLAGVSITAYWASTFLWEVATYLVPLSIVLLFMAAFNVEVYTKGTSGLATVILFLLYGPAVASFTYLLSFMFSSHSTAQNVVLLINFLTGLALMITAFVMTLIESTQDINEHLKYVYRLFPGFCLGDGLTHLAFCIDGKCTELSISDLRLGETSPFDWNIFGANAVFLSCQIIVYISLAIFLDFQRYYSKGQSWKWLSYLPGRNKYRYIPTSTLQSDEDDDVTEESLRVLSGRADQDVVRLVKLRKVYHGNHGSKVAVQELTFGIPKGETFGFLGVNGAGKSTTMSILVGIQHQTSGEGYICDMNIREKRDEVNRLIGYCPQHDALLDLLTVWEHLQLFAELRRIPRFFMDSLIEEKLQALGLQEFSNTLASALSGGNKRKLCLALSLIGEPSIVFLDEPSTGMDPLSKRLMWRVIREMALLRKECSVILTTHSMEEAEALCSRIAIMVNGRIRCLGSAQHLKDRFGDGYEVDVKLSSVKEEHTKGLCQTMLEMGAVDLDSQDHRILACPFNQICNMLQRFDRIEELTETGSGSALVELLKSSSKIPLTSFCEWWITEDRADALNDFIFGNFPGSTLLERSTSYSFRYRLPVREDQSLGSLFAEFERNRDQLFIEEYSIGQTSLERVFNTFASKKNDSFLPDPRR